MNTTPNPTASGAQPGQSNAYCVVFRTGGTTNFQWHRSLPMSREQADSRRQEMTQGGHTCYLVNYAQSVSIGLPSTFASTKWEEAEARKQEELLKA